jgi:hypothetical protein
VHVPLICSESFCTLLPPCNPHTVKVMQFDSTRNALWCHFVAMNADLSVNFQSAEHGGDCRYYGLVECDTV